MSATAQTSPPPPGMGGDGASSPEARHPLRRPALPRRYALLIAGAAVAILLLGWLADVLVEFAPRTGSAGAPQVQQAGIYRVSLALDPAEPHAGGAARLILRVTDTASRPITNADVRLTLDMPAMIMTPTELRALPTGDGAYSAQTAFPMSGIWSVAVRISPPFAPAAQTRFQIHVRQ